MSGNILALAKRDALRFSSAGGFEVTVVLSNPGGTFSLGVTGPATGTWMLFDDTANGKTVGSSSNSFTIHEVLLINGSYPYKDANGRVSMKNHKVSLDDKAGMSGSYTINEVHYNSTLGLIVCILGRVTAV